MLPHGDMFIFPNMLVVDGISCTNSGNLWIAGFYIDYGRKSVSKTSMACMECVSHSAGAKDTCIAFVYARARPIANAFECAGERTFSVLLL